MTTSSSATVSLTRIQRETALIRVEGTAPLIVHAWSQKARTMMLDAQQGRKTPKQPKNPEQDFLESMYRFEDGGHGFPTMAFKQATVKGGGRAFGKSVKMTEMRQMLTFIADGFDAHGMQLTRLEVTEPVMREDLVRVGMGSADLRYRAEYREWAATLRVEFLPSVIDLGSVVALIDAGGMNGIGEWRPEKSGSFGTFQVTGGRCRMTSTALEIVGVTAPVAGELRTLYQRDGELTTHAVVEAATDPASPLHAHFEWDDSRAASEHRLNQAAALIRRVRVQVLTADDRPPVSVRAYVARSQLAADALTDPGAYLPVEAVAGHTAWEVNLRDSIARDLERVRRKYAATNALLLELAREVFEE